MSSKMQALTRHMRSEVTDPKYHPVTSAFWPMVRQMAGRGGVGVRVLRDTSGAPARYIGEIEKVDINVGLISHLTPQEVADPSFAVRNPSLFGAFVHECCHAAQSRMDLQQMAASYGGRHTQTFLMLEESRAEYQNQRNLTELQKAGLRACILEIVLRDIDQTDDDEDLSQIQIAIRMVGLLGGRVQMGLIPRSNPLVERIVRITKDTLTDEYYDKFMDLSRRFTSIEWTPRYFDDSEMHAIVREWMALEDEIAPPDEQGGRGGHGQPGEDEGDGEGQGEGDGEGQGEGDGEGEDIGSASSTTPRQKSGEVHDTPQHSSPDQDHEVIEHTGGDALGRVDSGHYSTVDNEDMASVIEALRDAATDIKQQVIHDEIGPAQRAQATATAKVHEKRRRLNAEHSKLWSKS